MSPSSTWASHAVLGFRCARGDWNGALSILDNNLSSGLIDKATYRRQRGVLLTARALELEKVDRDLARESAMEAVKLAPTLVPAAVLAAKFESEAHQVRRAMRVVETAWLAQPHPDLADAYAHVKLGDSARQRLVRMETLAAKMPGHIEGALAVARAAIDASEFARARAALAPFIDRPTQRVARADGGDRAHRTWRQRPRAGLDAARGARAARSGVDRGWLCQRPLAAGVAGHRPARCVPVADAGREPAVGQGAAIESSAFEDGMLAAPPPKRIEPATRAWSSRRSEETIEATPVPAAQDNVPPAATVTPAAAPSRLPPPHRSSPPRRAAAKSRIGPGPGRAVVPRPTGHPQGAAAKHSAVIPIVRPPDDPGIDDEAPADEFSEQIGTPKAQAGGWRGFLVPPGQLGTSPRGLLFLANPGPARYQVRAFRLGTPSRFSSVPAPEAHPAGSPQ